MKKSRSYAKHIFNFAMGFMSTYVFDSPASAVVNLPNEDSQFGISAIRRDFCDGEGLKIPDEKDGKIPTLNQTGFMTIDQNPYTLQFIDFAARCSAQSREFTQNLEIGTAYGRTALLALKEGARLIANDIDERHLLLLREQVPEELRANLTLNRDHFPDKTNFPELSLVAILACRVLHFLSGEEMEKGIEKIKRWLVPGGRLFVVTMSPYHRHLKEKFLPLYLEKAREGNPCPGMIQNMHQYIPHEKEQIPEFVHVMDGNSLGNALRRHSFNIIAESLFDFIRPGAEGNEGKGYYGIVVEKPVVEESGE